MMQCSREKRRSQEIPGSPERPYSCEGRCPRERRCHQDAPIRRAGPSPAWGPWSYGKSRSVARRGGDARLALVTLLLVGLCAVAARAETPAVAVSAASHYEGSWLAAQIGGVRGEEKAEAKEEPSDGNRIDGRRAMLYSLLLPGLGQQYAGRAERARVGYAVEAAIWASFITFRVQESQREDRYVEFAERFAGAEPAGKNDDYWRTIANFERADGDAGSANELIRRQARALYPDDRAAQQAYEQANGYFGDRAWDWQTSDNLARYRQLRGRALDSGDRATYSIALALVHRVISVIDAARVAHQANKAASGQSKLLEPRGRLGIKLAREAGHTVPLLTYKATF